MFAFESKKPKYNLVRKKNAYVPGKRVKTLYPCFFYPLQLPITQMDSG